VFGTLDAVGGVKLRRFTGEYTPEGNQVLGDGRITFESVYRFKGQEAPAVIRVDVEVPGGPSADPARVDRAQRVRARSRSRPQLRATVIQQGAKRVRQ
jgi:superfamily I DNA and RNA helicase